MSTETAATSITWTPPAKIEQLFSKTAGGTFASINSAVAGARTEQELPVGSNSIQLYSHCTPNGQKVSILLEELGIDYDAHVIATSKGEQFSSGFVAVNPNSKIPAIVDKDGPNGAPINVFESASILIYLAEKYGRFYPANDLRLKTEVLNWLFWQMSGFGPMCGNFGHFFLFAPPDKLETRDYGTARYGMEVQRLFSVLDNHLTNRTYLVGEEYTIADMAIFPWAHPFLNGYKSMPHVKFAEFLSIDQYTNVAAWITRILARPAVERGLVVCA